SRGRVPLARQMRRPLLRPRSLQNRLALLFLAITALAFAAVIFFFLPQLESRLEQQRLQDLERTTATSAPRLEAVIGRDITGPQLDELVRAVADAANARVTLLGVRESSASPRAQFYVISDSNAERSVQPDTKLAAKALGLRR